MLIETGKRQFSWDIGRTTLWRFMSKDELKPWLIETYCIVDVNEEYLRRMYQILNLYEKEYDYYYPVICIDEKSIQIQSHIIEPLAMTCTTSRREDYQYRKGEVLNFFVAVEPKGGRRIYQMTKRKRGVDFAWMMFYLVYYYYKHAKIIYLVADNLSTHKNSILIKHLGSSIAAHIISKVEWVYTPVHASWLNMAEIEIGNFDKQCLNQRFDSVDHISMEVQAYLEDRNIRSIPINWHYTVFKAKKKFPELKDIEKDDDPSIMGINSNETSC